MGKIFLRAWPIIWLTLMVGFFAFAPGVLASDNRVTKVAEFLEEQDSPLVPYAGSFVTSADKYELDYRLLVAISGVESSFGKQLLPDSYNAYGWGGGLVYFKSWTDGIDQISQGLKENYIDHGANDIWQIGIIYCPPNSASWSAKVNFYMDQIEKENANEYLSKGPTPLSELPLTI